MYCMCIVVLILVNIVWVSVLYYKVLLFKIILKFEFEYVGLKIIGWERGY